MFVWRIHFHFSIKPDTEDSGKKKVKYFQLMEWDDVCKWIVFKFYYLFIIFLYLSDHDEIGQIAKNLLVQIEKLILIGLHLT